MRMLANVQQGTIQPILLTVIALGTVVFTDEDDIYSRLSEWGYRHRTVCHSRGEYARDEDGDGFHEVHVNTMEGVWSLLRSWLRPHRGVSQEHLPLYLAFFELTHNLRRPVKPQLEVEFLPGWVSLFFQKGLIHERQQTTTVYARTES